MGIGAKWAEADSNSRVVITLRGKEQKPAYVYSKDVNFCKALVVKIKIVANPLFLMNLTTNV